jgi:hypothetical protein
MFSQDQHTVVEKRHPKIILYVLQQRVLERP